MLYGAVYLLAHGIIKVALVMALLLNKLWAYPWMIVLAVFIAYQAYRIVLSPSVGLLALTVFDLVIIALTWRGDSLGEALELGAATAGLQQRRRHRSRP